MPVPYSSCDLLECSSPTDCANIVVDDLIGSGLIGRRSDSIGFCCCVFARKRRNIDRSWVSTVTGIASYFAGSVEMILIDSEHHAHHAASGLFRFLGVVVEMIWDVAKRALHAQG